MKSEFVVLFAIVSCVLGHGYMVVPQARQSMCFEGQSHMPGLWSGNIPDPACRAAFNYVRAKGNPSPQEGTPAEVFQFQQRNEFANFNTAPGHNPNNYPNIVPNGEICSAGNNWPDRTSPRQFGDKTGLSVLAPWRKNTIRTNNIGGYQAVRFQYCATQPHNPSVWHVYYQPGDSSQTVIRWDTLSYLGEIGNILPRTSPTTIPNCFSNGVPHNIYYEFTIGIPMPIEGGTIVIAWQRIDPVGEFFMECIDYQPYN
jgi:chitin-binding protein